MHPSHLIFIVTVLILLILIVLGFFVVLGFKEIVKYFHRETNYDLHCSECVTFIIPILTLVASFLAYCNRDGLGIHDEIIMALVNIIMLLFPLFMLASLIFLTTYYIIRSKKLKKYIPLKVLIYNILMGIICLILVSISVEIHPGLDSGGGFGVGLYFTFFFFLPYVGLYSIYLIILILKNIMMVPKRSMEEENLRLKNTHYKIGKLGLFSILIVIVITGLLYGAEQYAHRSQKSIEYGSQMYNQQ